MLHSWSDGWMPWRIATWEWSAQRSLVFLVLLRRKIACRVVHSAKSSPKPYFTAQGLFSYLFKEGICEDKESAQNCWCYCHEKNEWLHFIWMVVVVFNSLSVSSQLIVLLLDGCFSLELVKTAAEQDMCLPPHNGWQPTSRHQLLWPTGVKLTNFSFGCSFGLYEDDIDESGAVTCEWIQCTN